MKLYNTLTRQIEEVKPLFDNTIKMYTCGITVYSHPHIGNWVGYIYWDVLQRTLENEGFTVIRTQNYTDVGHLTSDDDSGEDKMEKGAKADGITAWDVAEKYITICENESARLHLKVPTYLIRATSLIKEQIEFVSGLEEKDFTYIIPGDGVYFDTSKLTDYGKLAKLDIDGLEAGVRVSIEGKRNITDFALWKFSPTEQKRDMEWSSPWGVGFPGWHLECSVIARQTLGDQIDIHCGGIDHIPVHHTNEIAQTESLTGKQFSQIWVHNNHIKVDGTKMSKSLGNIYTLTDIAQKGYDVMAFKYMILSKHYTTEGNFTWDNLAKHSQTVLTIRNARDMILQPKDQPTAVDQEYLEAELSKIKDALGDKLNTPEALQLLEHCAKRIKGEGIYSGDTLHATKFFEQIDGLLGFDFIDNKPDAHRIASLVEEFSTAYNSAKQSKDFSTSDKLRDQIQSYGYELSISKDGKITWYANMRATLSANSTLKVD